MITEPTLLILGAGASMPYGYPSGQELVKIICKKLSQDPLVKDDNWVTFYNSMGFDILKLFKFRDALHNSGQLSIDAFLELRKEYLFEGKMAIALALVPIEKPDILVNLNNPFPDKPDLRWYWRLLSSLRTNNPEDFTQNQLSVITFNYDRSFEEFLFITLQNSYDLQDDKCAQIINSIPIVHIYGTLGRLQWQSKEDWRKYGDPLTTKDAGDKLSTIKVIHEGAEENFIMAHQLLDKAKKIIFLGFGYNSENLKRLRIDTFTSTRIAIGTTFDLRINEVNMIKKAYPRIWLAEDTDKMDCLEFLRSRVQFQ